MAKARNHQQDVQPARQIELVRILPLHGFVAKIETIEDAIECIEQKVAGIYTTSPFGEYEILVRYTNGDTINATLISKEEAVSFLRSFMPDVHLTNAQG